MSKATLAVRFLLKHWDREKRPYTPDLNGCNNSWFALLNVSLTRLQGRGRELRSGCYHSTHVYLWVRLNRCSHEKFSERRFRLRPPYGDMMQFVAVPTTDTSTYCVADTDGPL